jgi:hypothetical protein
MEKERFVIRDDEHVSLTGRIASGCLHLASCIYDEDFESDMYYDFTKEDTDKLFQVLSFDEFIELCINEGLLGLNEFLKEHDIKVDKYVC